MYLEKLWKLVILLFQISPSNPTSHLNLVKSISLVLTRFGWIVCFIYFVVVVAKLFFFYCVKEIFGTCDETLVDKVFVLLLPDACNKLCKFVYITTKLYICPCLYKRLLQKQIDWQKSGCDDHIILVKILLFEGLSLWWSLGSSC